MGLPLYGAGDDPGPSFFRYAEDAGLTWLSGSDPGCRRTRRRSIAVRYVGGVVMVGDRQATGNYIASRDVRKIEAADAFTASPSRAPRRAASSSSAWPSSPSSTTRR